MKKETTRKYGIVIDSSRCIDCKACLIACKVENQLPEGYWRNWIKSLWDMQGSQRSEFQPGQCMQCENPSCVAACPVGATYKGKNGIVVIDAKTCIGCGNCISACPYGARYRNTAQHIADKCDFCMHRVERGEEPACVTTCPTKTRIFGDLNDPESEVSRLVNTGKLVQVIAPHVNTKPHIYYHAGTRLLDWAVTPTLPGNVHMAPDYWKES